MMRLGIMQPYFFPYIGYYQLIDAVDQFVIYDNIKYTKKGWINRNRFLQNGKDVIFSLPLKKDSDYLDIMERELSIDFNRDKLLNQLKGAYKRAPFFTQSFPLIEQVLRFEDRNLFRFLHNSIVCTCAYLGLETRISISSAIEIDHSLKNQEKVIALCEAIGADTYVNAIGGMGLYSKEVFNKKNIDLKFIQTLEFKYPQFGGEFVPWLSMIDVLMFNSSQTIKECISSNYQLV